VKQNLIEGMKCPKCGEGDLAERKARRGNIFWGCTNYPKCDFTSNYKPVAKKCPECGSPYLVEKTLKSGVFPGVPEQEEGRRGRGAPEARGKEGARRRRGRCKVVCTTRSGLAMRRLRRRRRRTGRWWRRRKRRRSCSRRIPVAYAMPDSELVGFDLARLPIERGQERIRELGLEEYSHFSRQSAECGAELGRFDYIIAHGFYAWVPEPVRDRLLALCGELLTANGVAFVSYNALAGQSSAHYDARDDAVSARRASTTRNGACPKGWHSFSFWPRCEMEGDPIRLLFEERLKKIDEARTGRHVPR
jgi:hypothetical protein